MVIITIFLYTVIIPLITKITTLITLITIILTLITLITLITPLQVAYFVVSIVNSLAQSYRKRMEREKRID